ncbi:hypothetical protein TUMEXPCC7403_17505 [Tumidithrix helvetica PCC 7403]
MKVGMQYRIHSMNLCISSQSMEFMLVSEPIEPKN